MCGSVNICECVSIGEAYNDNLGAYVFQLRVACKYVFLCIGENICECVCICLFSACLFEIKFVFLCRSVNIYEYVYVCVDLWIFVNVCIDVA